MTHKGMRGLVLDLRGNPGGYLDAAVEICDLLIASGEIVTTRGRGGKIRESYSASGDASFTDFPMAVIVNQGSATPPRSSPRACKTTIGRSSSASAATARLPFKR